MHICLVTSGDYPMPAVCGGAVETIIQNLIEENERQKLLRLTIVSGYNKLAIQAGQGYLYSIFKYIKNKGLIKEIVDSKPSRFLRRVLRKLIGKELWASYYVMEAYRIINKADFDYIIIEGGSLGAYRYISEHIGKEKMIAHVHGVCEGSKELSDIYSKFMCVSNFVKNRLIDNGKICAHEAVTIYNCIDTKLYLSKLKYEDYCNIRNRYNINVDDQLILFCGRLIPEKGVKELILAYKKIANPKNKLLIVGSAKFAYKSCTEYEKHLSSLIEDMSSNVIFAGYVDQSEMWKIYKISNILVIPSLCAEAMGLVAVEGVLSGNAIVASKVGGLREVLKNQNVRMVDLNEQFIDNMSDCILDLLSCNQRKNDAIDEYANKFSIETYYNSLLKILYRDKKESSND